MRPAANGSQHWPPDELLLAYLAHSLTDAEAQRLEAHLGECDACVEALPAMQHRLTIGAEVAAPIPTAVATRADVVAASVPRPTPLPALQPHRATVGRQRDLRGILATLLQLPILIPSSVAAGVLLVVVARTLFGPTALPRPLTRSVEVRESLRVTAAEAIVRTEPDPQARVVGTLVRGDQANIDVQQRNWCRVLGPNGVFGWVECHVFR